MGHHRGYSSYRGRRTLTDVLKLVAVVLAVLVGLLLAALWFGRDYLTHTREDPPPPLLQDEDGPDPAPPDGSVPREGGASAQPEEQPGDEPQPASESEPPMAALELPLSAVLDGSAGQRLEQAGANALVLVMKDEQGMLGFSSQQELAASAQVNARDEGVNEKLRAWNQGGVYTVARVCCFRDNTLPYHRNDLALRAGYGNWRDELGLRWLDLDSRQARDYLAGLCGELAQLGFDEIVLECPALPCQGNLDAVVQTGSHAGSPQDRAAEAEAFLAQVEQAVESAGAVVSLRVDRALLSEGGGVSGVTPGVLQKRPGRIWAAEDGQSPALSELLSQAGVATPEERLVVLTPRLDGSLGAPQACFQEEGGE